MVYKKGPRKKINVFMDFFKLLIGIVVSISDCMHAIHMSVSGIELR